MDRISVVYATKTGHSRKLAQAIGQALRIDAQDVLKTPAPRPAELLFIVGGIYGGKSLPELVGYTESLPAGQVKKAVLVTSSVSVKTRSQTEIRRILTEKGIDVVEEIACPGSFLFVHAGQPSAAEIQKAAERARQLARQQ